MKCRRDFKKQTNSSELNLKCLEFSDVHKKDVQSTTKILKMHKKEHSWKNK